MVFNADRFIFALSDLMGESGEREPVGSVAGEIAGEMFNGDTFNTSNRIFDQLQTGSPVWLDPTPTMNGDEIDRFMEALAEVESGGDYNVWGPSTRYGRAYGKYQILQSNWPSWAAEAGIAGADMTDPDNQDIVARYMMNKYFREFGRWDAVAVAWFAGPDDAEKWVKYGAGRATSSDGYNTIAEYVEKVMDNFDAPTLAAQGGGVFAPTRDSVWNRADVGNVTEIIADAFGVTAGSHYRDPAHNARVGGAENSNHLWGGARDFTGDKESLDALYAWAVQYLGEDGPFDEVLWQVDDHYDHLHLGFNQNAATFSLPGVSGNLVPPGPMPVESMDPRDAAIQAFDSFLSFDDDDGVAFGRIRGNTPRGVI